MSYSEPALDGLRRDIDGIDDAIHDLLMRRCELVEEIARVKGRNHGVYMRPGREATILRRLVDRHRGAFPPAVLVRIWREMLAAFTLLQGPFAVSVCAPPDRRELWDIARDHYGSVTPMTAMTAPMQAIRAVTEGAATVAVVPWPDDRDGEPWWPALVSGDPKTPRIIARLPFIVGRGRSEDTRALALAQVSHEATGDDHTMVSIELSGPISRSRLREGLIACGLSPVAFWSCVPTRSEPQAVPPQLVEVDDFVADDDLRLGQLLDWLGDYGRRALPIGGFAMPLSVSGPVREGGR
jgi:chorismate mutase-like protein